MAYISDIEINNVTLQLHGSRHGMWSIYDPPPAGEEARRPLASDTDLDKAKNAARLELNKRKVKVAVPFIDFDGRRGTAHGFHARTREVLTVMEDGSKERYSYSTNVFRDDMPKKTLEEYLSIRDKQQKLTARARAITDEWMMQLNGATRQALDEKIKQQEEDNKEDEEQEDNKPIVVNPSRKQPGRQRRRRRH